MSTTLLALASYWSWDHSHVEIATIAVENYELKAIGGPDNLNHSNLPEFLLSQIEEIKKAQDGSIMGKNKLLGLYIVKNRPRLLNIGNEPEKVHLINLEMKPICGFDDQNNPTQIKQS